MWRKIVGLGVVGLRKCSARCTRRIGIHWGQSLPIYFVANYPKSGATWLTHMLSDYLDLPFPQFTLLPVTHPAVVQVQWEPDPRLRHVVFLQRDGRDVMNSLFFERIRTGRFANVAASPWIDAHYRALLGDDYEAEDVRELLPRFLEYELTHPGRGCKMNWNDYVLEWCSHQHPGVVRVSYEDLRTDCVGTLSRVVGELIGEDPDPWRVKIAVEKYNMRRVTGGRKPGQEDIRSHARKAVVGDWKNNFSREAAEVFHHYCAEAMALLGYEPDGAWVESCAPMLRP